MGCGREAGPELQSLRYCRKGSGLHPKNSRQAMKAFMQGSQGLTSVSLKEAT